MSEWTRSFNEVGVADVSLVGGKAANLGEMVRAGLQVPPGFCVTAAAYRRSLAQSDGTAAIARILGELEVTNQAAVEAATARLRETLIGQPLPPAIADSIIDRYRQLAEIVGEPGAPEPALLVAVRSSATAEDLPDASFAGQQDTYLNVSGIESLLEHVKRCWASLWTARAVTYRERQGYDHGQVALAVAVQSMVAADVAGVLFTANPLTSDRGEMVVNASWGLGEAIVSGVVTPDTWSIRKDGLAIVSRRVGHKTVQVRRAADGTTDERPVPGELQDVPSLSDAQLLDLARVGTAIEDHYRAPMDVEWALADGRFFVLQARPITTLTEDDRGAYPAGDFNRTMFLEIFPDPLSPAFTSVIEPLFAGMLDFTFRSLGFKPPAGIPAVHIFHNQPYFNQRYIEAAFAPLRPSTRQVFVSRIVNPFSRHGHGAPFEPSLPFLRMAWRLLRLMRSLHVLLPREVGRYRETIAELDELDLESLHDAQLLERIERLVFTSSSRLLNYDFLLIALVGVTYQALGRLLEPYFGHESEDIQARLVSGVTGNVTMETNIRLWDLSRLALGSTAVRSELQRGDDDLRERLARTAEGQSFLDELDRFLAEYGHREVRMDILYPTWNEDPAPVLFFVRGYLDVDDATSPHRQQERLIREREELAERVRLRLRRDLRGRLLWPLFSWVLRHTQANTRERDTMHFELTRLFPPFRRLLLELGHRWVKSGVMLHAEDVFFLTLDEMRELTATPRPMHDQIEQRRLRLETNRRQGPPPIIRDGREIWSEEGEPAEAAGDEMRGVAGSPGRVRGVVRVVRDPDDFGKLGQGEILVAPLTNPVWTPLFAIAGGLITEVGGILSHGAIVAREYGIPAVMALSGATSRLSDGQLVEVDGSAGTVRLVSDEPLPSAALATQST